MDGRSRDGQSQWRNRLPPNTEEMVGFVFASKHSGREMERPTKEGRSTHKDSEGTHSVVGRDGGARGLRGGIRSQHLPGILRRQQRGTMRARAIPSWLRGSMGW